MHILGASIHAEKCLQKTKRHICESIIDDDALFGTSTVAAAKSKRSAHRPARFWREANGCRLLLPQPRSSASIGRNTHRWLLE